MSVLSAIVTDFIACLRELRSLRSMVRLLPVRSLPTKSHFSQAKRKINFLGRLSDFGWKRSNWERSDQGAKLLDTVLRVRSFGIIRTRIFDLWRSFRANPIVDQ